MSFNHRVVDECKTYENRRGEERERERGERREKTTLALGLRRASGHRRGGGGGSHRERECHTVGMVRAPRRTARFLMIALLLTSLLASTKADDAAAGGAEAEQDAAGNDESSAEPQPIVLNCHPADLLEPLVTWSVDCTAQWIENMGFGAFAFTFSTASKAPVSTHKAALAAIFLVFAVASFGIGHPEQTLLYVLEWAHVLMRQLLSRNRSAAGQYAHPSVRCFEKRQVS